MPGCAEMLGCAMRGATLVLSPLQGIMKSLYIHVAKAII